MGLFAGVRERVRANRAKKGKKPILRKMDEDDRKALGKLAGEFFTRAIDGEISDEDEEVLEALVEELKEARANTP